MNYFHRVLIAKKSFLVSVFALEPQNLTRHRVRECERTSVTQSYRRVDARFRGEREPRDAHGTASNRDKLQAFAYRLASVAPTALPVVGAPSCRGGRAARISSRPLVPIFLCRSVVDFGLTVAD